jgi:hypothetical protein
LSLPTYNYTRLLIKSAAHASNEGDHARAIALLRHAISNTHQYGDVTPATRLTPRIRHRQAMALKHTVGPKEAEVPFDMAMSMFTSDRDKVGTGITARDRGLMWVEAGKPNRGMELIESSIDQLVGHNGSTRQQMEWTVSQGFMARTPAMTPKQSIDVFMMVRDTVTGTNKLVYDLDNERAMQPVLVQEGYTKEYIRSRARSFALYRLIVAKNHGLSVADNLVEGRFGTAAVECATGAYRMVPHAFRTSD